MFSCLAMSVSNLYAQSYTWFCSTENDVWKETKIKLQSKSETTPILKVTGAGSIQIFKRWGTCFNELGWDALNLLSLEQQDAILSKLFSPDGELHFSMGRIPMNANDYARDWYSCDEVDGDFQLKYFNIDRDKKTIIPFIRKALHYNPNMTFWASPWSPPSWMKVNHYYSILSNDKVNKMSPLSNVILHENSTERNDAYYPKQLAVNDYFIQDTRYLRTYADYFCRFISAYQDENIPVTKVMFQNEPWAFIIYPD